MDHSLKVKRAPKKGEMLCPHSTWKGSCERWVLSGRGSVEEGTGAFMRLFFLSLDSAEPGECVESFFFFFFVEINEHKKNFCYLLKQK